jgi:hypothetical protein
MNMAGFLGSAGLEVFFVHAGEDVTATTIDGRSRNKTPATPGKNVGCRTRVNAVEKLERRSAPSTSWKQEIPTVTACQGLQPLRGGPKGRP